MTITRWLGGIPSIFWGLKPATRVTSVPQRRTDGSTDKLRKWLKARPSGEVLLQTPRPWGGPWGGQGQHGATWAVEWKTYRLNIDT